jgi:hypothetical protein
MIVMLLDPLPVSLENFAAVSETSPNRDSAFVPTWQSATHRQPGKAQSRRLTSAISARPHVAAGPQLFRITRRRVRFSTGGVYEILTSSTYYGRRDSRTGAPRPPSQWGWRSGSRNSRGIDLQRGSGAHAEP